jgi:hypothetical protein
MDIKKLIPGLQPMSVTADDGLVCGVLVLYCPIFKKMYISYRSNLYAGLSSVMAALRNNRHPIKALQEAYDLGTLEEYIYPTDTVGEALDLKSSILDQYAKEDVFFNVFSTSHIARVTSQLARFPARKSSKVSVNGTIYESRKEAAIVFGFSESTVSYRIKSSYYPDWKLVE